jgi:hypothetical protein
MKGKLTRKKFLELTTKGAIGTALAVSAVKLSKAETKQTWPYPYQQLDPEYVRKLGHQSYWTGKGCAYGAFNAIVKALAEKIGEPFSSFPTDMLIFGHGGVVGWGGTCGALIGAAAAIQLVCDKATADKLIHELQGWYTQTLFPSDISNQYAQSGQFFVHNYDNPLPQSSCGSVLCHISVTKWCDASGYKSSSTERKERCGRLTGDVAAYAVKLLNDWFSGQFQSQYKEPGTITGCMSCHGTAYKDDVKAKMECTQCHKPNWAHPQTKVEQLSEVAFMFRLGQAYPNPFNPTTNIEFSIPKSCDVRLEIYDLSGKIVRRLIDGVRYEPGVYKVTWDGTDDHGNRVASGVYIYRMTAGSYTSAKKVVFAK